MISIISISIFTLLCNVYLGRIRAGVKKYTLKWYVLIHASVPIIIACRIGLDVPYRFSILFVVLAGMGQLLGTRLPLNKK